MKYAFAFIGEQRQESLPKLSFTIARGISV